ncbi:MAG: TonB-dependent receptor plug domain-containing protein, partial [Terracidiphilus sp.]
MKHSNKITQPLYHSERLIALLSCSMLALLAGQSWAADSAVAQAPGQAGNFGQSGELEEIIVTANKREERLDKVGATIAVISAQELAERKITTLSDIAEAVPGLSFAQSSINTPILTLRGVGFNQQALGSYPAVSVYIDQAPLPFPVYASHSAYDLQQIEVLKGPQGTTFGENATGGAINYIAAKPTSTL